MKSDLGASALLLWRAFFYSFVRNCRDFQANWRKIMQQLEGGANMSISTIAVIGAGQMAQE